MVGVFDHEKLEVYRIAVEYADLANAHIRDQLRRASDSIVNNIAEGAGEFLPNEKARRQIPDRDRERDRDRDRVGAEDSP